MGTCQALRVSFHVFLQSFDSVTSPDGDRVRAYLEPMLGELIVAPVPGQELTDMIPVLGGARSHVVTSDGSSEISGLDDLATGLSFNRLKGNVIWDVIHTVATIAYWVVIPIGCPVCVIDPEQAATLPPELVNDTSYRLVRSGADIRHTVETAP